jgi:uncharacterized protein
MGQSTPIQKDPMTKAAVNKGRCPICKDETEHAFRPFCSSRCADIDLGKWMTGSYAIPVTDHTGDSEDDGSDAVASRTNTAAQRKPEVPDDEDH